MKTLFTTKYLEFKSTKSPSNHDWCYVRRTNDKPNQDSAVVITPLVKINGEFNFLFIKTTRPPLSAENKARYCLECPAGLIADKNTNETLEECLKKELLEETGYIADDFFIELKNSPTSAGLSSETLTYATAIINNPKQAQKPINDGGIILDWIFVPASKINEYLLDLNQEICIPAPTICAIYYALKRLS